MTNTEYKESTKIIVDKFLSIQKNIKIYVYEYYPSGYSGLKHFINETKKNRNYDWGETYKSWLYFID